MLVILTIIYLKEYAKQIPLEFNELKEKALSSARKRMNQVNTDEVIIPSKPYIKDEFIGFVNHALFAKTVSKLRGYAISNNYEHIAIIVDRQTNEGHEMMKEKSMFIDKKTKSAYSLFLKCADDGKVAIFNMSKIDEFQIFDRFQLTLSRYSQEYQCTNTGKNFGGRCCAEENFNWNDEKDMPGNTTITIKNFSFDIYHGMKSRAETSVIVKKTGAFNIQAEMDSSYDFSGGIGFKIPAFNKSISNLPIAKEKTRTIVQKIITIFFLDLNITVLLKFQPILEQFEAKVTKPISLIKVFKLHLRNNIVVSTKHQKTQETEKDFHIETLFNTDDVDEIDDKSFQTEVSINGTISLKAGIRVEFTLAKSYFKVEGGVAQDFDLALARNTTKCTAPAIFGHFIPSTNLYINADGLIKLGFITLLKKSKGKKWEILRFGNYGSCVYKDDISKELDKDLTDKMNQKLNVLLFDNFKASSNGFYSISNNLSSVNRLYNKYLFLENVNNNIYPNKAFVFTNENNNFTKLQSLVTFKNKSVNGSSNLSDSLNITDDFYYDAKTKINKVGVSFNYSIKSYKSKPVKYGTVFNINKDEFINSIPINIAEFPMNLGLIYKVNKSYYAHYDDYSVINEYEDALHDELINDVYRASDYSGFNISIELNDKNNHECYFNRTNLSVYHIQNITNEHLLYVTRFGCDNGKINELFNSSLIFVPLTETKGNVNCIRINFLNDTFNLTRNDLIKQNSTIIKKSELFTYTINVSYPVYPNFVFQLNKPKDSIENQTIVGIVSRFFQFRNNDIIPFDGIPQRISFRMAKNEVYGIYRGLFHGHGENLSNLYALIHMPGIQPLTNNAELIESDSYFVKLIENETLIKRKQNNEYDIIIPFRRRSVNKNNSLEITLKMIFQAENSKNDPYCSTFSNFSLKRNEGFYAGCIHNFSKNAWEHFTSYNYDIIREQEIDIPNSKYKLHCINLKKIPDKKKNDISVYATQRYIEFPST